MTEHGPNNDQESGQHLVDLAVEIDEQLKNMPASSDKVSSIQIPEDRVSGLTEEELIELKAASSVLAFLGQVRSDITRLSGDSVANDEGSATRDEPVTDDVPPGQTMGRFEIVETLGQGGFARVFRAFDPLLDREIALKIPRPEALSSEEARARFIQEGKAVATLNHPAIVTVFEAGNFGPILYIACALCPGETLADWQAESSSAIPVKEAAAVVARLAEAIHHAHQRGIIHRDLKPSNVMIDAKVAGSDTLASRLRITDFGLAKHLHRESGKPNTLTIDGSVVGTPAYMSPEQVRCEPDVGPASDVFSLGVILHELLTGSAPHQKGSITATIRAVESETVPSLRRSRSEIPEALDAICQKCLEKTPGDRYESAFALAEDLNCFLNDRPVSARPAGPLKRLAKWAKRNPVIAISIGVTFASLVAGIATSWAMYRQSDRDRIAAVKATEAKSEALDLAQTRMKEMNEQMDLLAGIFDSLESDQSGNFDSLELRKSLKKNLVSASEQTFESDTDPLLRSRLAARLGHALSRLGGKESRDITTRAMELARQHELPEHELYVLEYYVAESHSADFQKIIDMLEPKLDQIVASDNVDELKKVAVMDLLIYAYSNLKTPKRVLAVQQRLFDYQKMMREKYLGDDLVDDERGQQSAIRDYFQSSKFIRTEAISRFHLAESRFNLDRSEANLNELLEARQWIEKQLTPHDWTSVAASYLVAKILGNEHQPEKAIEIGEAAYRNSVEKFDRGHYQSITASNSLVEICLLNPDAAICKRRIREFAEQAEEECDLHSKFAEASAQAIQILANVASAYAQLGDHDKAIKVQRENLKSAETHFGKDDALTKSQQAKLDELILQGRQQEPVKVKDAASPSGEK